MGALLAYHQFAFGAFWRTGYSLTHEQTGFGLKYFLRSAVPYIQNLQGQGAGLLFGLGLVGMATLCTRRPTCRHGLLLVTLVVPVTLLYMSYYWAPGGRAAGTMRFLLPTFFLYTLAAVWLLRMLSHLSPRAALTAALVILVVHTAWGLPESLRTLDRQQKPAAVLASVTDLIRRHVAPGNLIIADRLIQQHLDSAGTWRLVDETTMRPGTVRFLTRRLRNADGRPSPIQVEKLERRLERYRGLTPTQRVHRFATDLWNWAGHDRKVYWLTDRARLDAFGRILRREHLGTFCTVAELELPKVRVEPPPDGPPRDVRRRDRPPRGGPMQPMRRLLSGGKLILVEWTRPARF